MFNCENCEWGQHCDNSNPAPFDMWEIPEINFKSKTCLLPMITAQSGEFIELYNFYKSKILPFSGGVYDQPAKYLRAMKTIESHLNVK